MAEERGRGASPTRWQRGQAERTPASRRLLIHSSSFSMKSRGSGRWRGSGEREHTRPAGWERVSTLSGHNARSHRSGLTVRPLVNHECAQSLGGGEAVRGALADVRARASSRQRAASTNSPQRVLLCCACSGRPVPRPPGPGEEGACKGEGDRGSNHMRTTYKHMRVSGEGRCGAGCNCCECPRSITSRQ